MYRCCKRTSRRKLYSIFKSFLDVLKAANFVDTDDIFTQCTLPTSLNAVPFGAAKFQVDVKEGGGGGSDLNVSLTFKREEVNISTAPNACHISLWEPRATFRNR